MEGVHAASHRLTGIVDGPRRDRPDTPTSGLSTGSSRCVGESATLLSMPFPRSALATMRRQKGLVTRAQMLATGIPSATVDGWVARGQLELVEAGVYRQPGSAGPETQHLLAAVLRAGHRARLSGWSACALYRLEGFELTAVPWIVIPPERRVRGVGFLVQRSTLSREDLATMAGIPTVTPIRALIDVAARISMKARRVAIDDARRRGLVSLERLLDRAVALGRHRGALAIRRMFGSGVLDQDGELERELALALATVGLQPAWGMEVLPGVKPDACFPEASYVLEGDSRRYHTIESDRASDITREGLLRADGWHITRVRSTDLRQRRARLLADIVATRQERIDAGLGRPETWRPVHPGVRIRPPNA